MQTTLYSPLGVSELQNQINRVFNSFDNDSSAATAGWMPTVDIQEFDTKFQLYVDLPGVASDKVELTLDNGVLTISGERSLPDSDDGENPLNRRRERGHGHFHRRFILPDTVDSEKVKANSDNGVLEILIPKQAKAQPRRIEVSS